MFRHTHKKDIVKGWPKFGNKEGLVIILNKALYGLVTSSRRWNVALGDALTTMGFSVSRADVDLWIKKTNDGNGYEYIATHVDDVIIVVKDHKIHITRMARHFPIRKGKRKYIIISGE